MISIAFIINEDIITNTIFITHCPWDDERDRHADRQERQFSSIKKTLIIPPGAILLWSSFLWQRDRQI